MFSPFSEREGRKIIAVLVGGVLTWVVYALTILYLLYGAERAATGWLLLAAALTIPGYYLLTIGLSDRRGFAVGLALRLAALFAFPLLSDDVYRFLWDGAQWWHGLHPFAQTPEALATSPQGAAFAKTHGALLTSMNSAGYYTIYPTFSQLVFAIGGLLAKSPYWGVVLLKVPLLLGEIGVYTLLQRLRALPTGRGLPAHLYWLNPLVIVEVVGNAHFEGLALLGVLAAVYALRRAGVGWARLGTVSTWPNRGGFGPDPSVSLDVSVGPGLEDAAVAGVPPVGAWGYWKWVGLAAAALAAGALVKLVPLLLAPAFALACLWQRSVRMVFDDFYYRFAADPYRKAIERLRGAPSQKSGESNERALVTTESPAEPRTIEPEEEYIRLGEWPYGHPYEVVPPTPIELAGMRQQLRAARLATHSKLQKARVREEAEAAAQAAGGGPITFPLLRGHRLWRWSSAIGFGVSLLAIVGLGFGLTLIGGGVGGFGESLGLYFRTFEFNGSLYQVASALGEWYRGYNWIATVGPALGVLSTVTILGVTVYRTWRGLDFVETLLWCMGAYLACATTVHPWYFVYLVGLGSLTRYRWPLLLGVTAFLSYAAYATADVEVPTWALALEYLPVVTLAIWELDAPKRYLRQRLRRSS